MAKYRVVSIDGGGNPRWTANGTGIRFFAPDGKVLVASVQPAPSVHTGIPEGLFTIDADIRGGDILPDGRALAIKPASVARDPSVTVVLNALRPLDGGNR